MTVFLTGTCAETANDLDPKRLNRQIQECGWLIGMVEGHGKWRNHPCNFMYKDHIEWVKLYRDCLVAYKNKDIELCEKLSNEAELIKPSFICENLFVNFKRRLYTKDPNYYKKFEYLGKSESNYYFVDRNWWKYENGTKEIDNDFDK